MDMDDEPFHSDQEEQQQQQQQLFDDGIDGDDDDDGVWRQRERSPTPIYNESDPSDPKSKPRKRLIKKNGAIGRTPGFGGDDDVGSVPRDFVGEEFYEPSSSSMPGKKKRGKEEGSGERRKEKVMKKRRHGDVVGDKERLGMKKGLGSVGHRAGDPEEMKEMWDTIAGGNSEVFFSAFLMIFNISFESVLSIIIDVDCFID